VQRKFLFSRPFGRKPWPKPRLLLIDDDQELCAMLVKYLRPEGFDTSTAASDPAGLEQLARSPLDLVIFPVSNGMDAPTLNGIKRAKVEVSATT
jgi:DNA-binding response OmpR family regulator